MKVIRLLMNYTISKFEIHWSSTTSEAQKLLLILFTITYPNHRKIQRSIHSISSKYYHNLESLTENPAVMFGASKLQLP
ncbi:unnamed protein product [Malus baccata var. baccata]